MPAESRWDRKISEFVPEGEVPLNFVLIVQTVSERGRPRQATYLGDVMLSNELLGIMEQAKLNMYQELEADDASQG